METLANDSGKPTILTCLDRLARDGRADLLPAYMRHLIDNSPDTEIRADAFLVLYVATRAKRPIGFDYWIGRDG
jgi:hypothetical protein